MESLVPASFHEEHIFSSDNGHIISSNDILSQYNSGTSQWLPSSEEGCQWRKLMNRWFIWIFEQMIRLRQLGMINVYDQLMMLVRTGAHSLWYSVRCWRVFVTISRYYYCRCWQYNYHYRCWQYRTRTLPTSSNGFRTMSRCSMNTVNLKHKLNAI